jgi:hypothetical protein
MLTAVSLPTLAEKCDINNQTVIANYDIEEHGQATPFQLIRLNNQVAHFYPKNKITDTWVKYRNNNVALNRYFEDEKRAIEYQPTELKRKVSWEKKTQLITSKQINEMTLVTAMGSGCYQQQEYNMQKGDLTVRLSWLPHLKLVKRLQVSHNGNQKVWSLQNIDTSTTTVNTFFKQRYQYQSTDYADIGDMESDPFFTKMINLGFIDHTPQGFYNSQGDNISPAHHRH